MNTIMNITMNTTMNTTMNNTLNTIMNTTMKTTINTVNTSCDCCVEGGIMNISSHDIKEKDQWINQLMTNAHTFSDQFQLGMGAVMVLRITLGWFVSANNPYAQNLERVEYMLQLPQKLYCYNNEIIKATLHNFVKYMMSLMAESCQECNMPHEEVVKVLNGINNYKYENLEDTKYYRCACGMACCV